MDERPFCRNACFRHANVQSKAIFYHAMTIMDEIRGWEDEEKRVGFEICRLYVDLHQRGDKRADATPEMEEYWTRRLMSIMLGSVLVLSMITSGCLKSTITQHGIGLRNRYSVCGAMVHVMVFSANKVQ